MESPFGSKAKVLITGGAGFLGRGILRRAVTEDWDCEITVYSRDETKQDLCRRRYKDFHYLLGDVRDPDRLTSALTGHDVVIHAAAVKYIPEAEFNVSECIDVNVQGTRNVINAARRVGVRNVVCLSTDKAVQPINTYGMSKALVERLVSEPSPYTDTKVTAVRYGNVIGSTGSVIPLFQRQINDQGFITLTDPEMTRYWLTVDLAVTLVLIAATTSKSRVVFVPDLPAMRMGDLARAIAEDDSQVRIVGPRPGEKQHESLLSLPESVRATIGKGSPNFVLHPPGESMGMAQFELSSAKPSFFFEKERMLEAIQDAANV